MATYEINDSIVKRKRKRATPLGFSLAFVGVHTGEDEIITDRVTGYNYAANKIEGQEIYNLHKSTYKSSWFLLDLETGTRGYYPGIQLLYGRKSNPTGADIKYFVEDSGYTNVGTWYQLGVKVRDTGVVWHYYIPNNYNRELCYKQGYIVRYQETKTAMYNYYECIVDISIPEKFDISKWKKITPEEYDKTRTYKVGDLVYRFINQKTLMPYVYKCIEDIEKPEEFNIFKWDLRDNLIWQDDSLRYAKN